MNVSSNIQIAANGIECIQLRMQGLADELKDSVGNNMRQVTFIYY